MQNSIDIVLPWVDPEDAEWEKKRQRCVSEYQGMMDLELVDYDAVRYRDWGLLRYLFRGIEEFCPWVRKLHFVTEGHLPDWLNTSHPRLHVVRHEDYIPERYLPTFSSHPIELNMHRIKGLSDKFVYFNDDTFVIGKTGPEHFFPGGRPAGIPSPAQLWTNDLLSHVLLNNTAVINRNFSKSQFDQRAWRRWYSPRLGMRHLARQVAVSPWKKFSPFYIHHTPMAFQRSVLEEVWRAEYDELDATCSSKFRELSDVNCFLFSYWQLCSGDYQTVSPDRYGGVVHLGADPIEDIAERIVGGSSPVLCVNDGPGADWDRDQAVVEQAFRQILPAKSGFEK